MSDPGFWWEFAGRIGPPMFAGTVVAALLRSEFDWRHGALLAASLGLILVQHMREHHRKGSR